MQEQEVEGQAVEQNVEPVEQQEKMLTQTQVQQIVQREKALAAERARKEAEAQFQAQMQAEQQNKMQQQQAQKNENVSREVDVNAISQQVREELNREMQQRQLEQEMSNVANNYLTKMELARKSYEDFDKVTADFDAQNFPQLVYLVSGLDNAGSVIYELAKNPTKLAAVSLLAKESPALAQRELTTLAQSIAVNQQAQANADNFATPAPLDRLNPSRVSGSSGEPSVRDFRSQDWLRG